MASGHQSQQKSIAPAHQSARTIIASSQPDTAPFLAEDQALPSAAAHHLTSTGGTPPLPPKIVRSLQRWVGNRAVQRMVSRHSQPGAPVPCNQVSSLIQRSVTVGGFEFVRHNEVVPFVTLRRLQLESSRSDLSSESVPVPAEIGDAIEASRGLESWCTSGGDREIDGMTARMITDWYATFIQGFNAGEAAKARAASQRLAQAQESMDAAIAALQERILPGLRERQRSAFRADNSSTLLSISDTIATVLDTSLSCRSAIEAIVGERQALGTFVNTALVLSGQSPLANNRAAGVMRILDQVNRAYAGFQLVRSGLTLISGSNPTTQAQRGMGEIRAATSAYGAAGTLLGVSAGVSAYSTFYLAPMVDAALTMVNQMFDIVSRTENRRNIEAGAFDLVAWDLEPGGRAMFNYMLRVMHAGGSEDIPSPAPSLVTQYFLDHQSNFESGTRESDMPTTGWWLWEEVDQSRLRRWVFLHRQDVWGMLYGNTQVPSGELRL